LLAAIGSDESSQTVVAAGIEPVRLRAGDTLFAQGDPPDALYFVITGRLAVIRAAGNGDQKTIRRVGHGEIIGEMGLLDDAPRTASIVADRDSTLAKLPKREFDQLVQRDPHFLRGVAKTVVNRLANPRPDVDRVGTIAIAVADPAIDSRVFVSRMLQTLQSKHSVEHVSAASAAAALGGAEDTVAVERYLDEVESAHDFVLLETDRNADPWTQCALRRADRCLIVVGRDSVDESVVKTVTATVQQTNDPDLWLAVTHGASADQRQGSAGLAARYGADRVLHAGDAGTADVARVARLVTGTGTGIVLGGGGARGFAHIGVYRALAELGVHIDAVAGASIGGILGAGIAQSYSPDEVHKQVVERFSNVLDYTIPVVSMVKGERITREIDKVFAGVDIEDLALPFLCVSTNLTSSRQAVHTAGSVTTATRAGLAIPGVIPPVPSEGQLLVDGGVLDNLPIGPLHATGLVNTIIAIDVTPRLGPRARADFGLSVSGWKALRSKFGRRKKVYPGISSLLLRSMIVGSMEQRDHYLEAGLVDLYLTPDLRGISLLAFDQVDKVAEAGYEATYPVIEEWLKERAGGVVS
jgi:predicted acylesterase/phospholipase RssA